MQMFFRADRRDQNGPPPLLAGIPAYLRRSPGTSPRIKRRRRRGKRSGVLVKVKALLSSSCMENPRLVRGGFCYSSTVRRSLQIGRPWVRIDVPSPNAIGFTERPGPPMTAPTPRAVPAGSGWCNRTTVPLSGQARARADGVVHNNLRPVRWAATSPTPNLILSMALINARSLANKTFQLNDFFTSRGLDFMFLTETWLHVGESLPFSELLPPDCTFLSTPRTTGKGGGLACVFKSSFHCRQISSVIYSSFELQLFELNASPPLLCAAVYRPPKYNKDFIQEFESFLSGTMVDYDHVLIAGDMNIHVCCESSPLAKDFLALTDSFSLTQWVSGPTHNKGHTLDLVLTHGLTVGVNEICDNACISDHMPVLFTAVVPCTVAPSRPLVRRFRVINSDISALFSAAVDGSILSNVDGLGALSVDELVALFSSTCTSILDSVAPLRSRSPKTLSEPWITDSVRALRRSCRRAERKWKKDKLHVSFGILQDCVVEYQRAVKAAKTGYISNLVSNNIGRPKVLFDTLDSLVNPRDTAPVVPSSALCNDFLNYFVEKIVSLRSAPPIAASDPSASSSCPASLNEFKPISLTSLSEVVHELRPTNCPSDSVPSRLLKDAFDSVGSFILTLVHACFSLGVFPASFKHAIVQPLIKKPSLDPTTLSNFRPISKLPFLSKVLEKIVSIQLHSFLATNDVYEKFQSGFRIAHSTETALLRIFNDIILSVDSGCAAILVTLDLTAAFDTVDHKTLLARLEQCAGIKGAALMFLQSYLTDRSFSVQLGEFSSSVAPLTCGVPQGSILGPLLFSLYMLPLGSILRKHNVSFHCYADDVQLYLPLKLNCKDSFKPVTSALNDIKTWMDLNFLSLNDGKTEVILFGQKDSHVSNLGPLAAKNRSFIKSLGVTFDAGFNFERQIGSVVKGSFFQLRLLSKLKPYLSPKDLETVIHAFISSRLDYCNALYVGLDQRSLRRLQLVQNAAARLLTGTKKRDHITPVLASLHWLPVRFRIDFKILMFIFKALHGLAPQYLAELIQVRATPRTLRSSSETLLTVPRSRLKTKGDRAFAVAGPKLWNSLPPHIRHVQNLGSFKSQLKTHLFSLAFEA